MTDRPTLLSASDEVSRGDDVAALALLLHAGSSLGGARPKAHVRMDSGRVAIAKFPSASDEWNVMAWEKTALDLAAAAGIRTPVNHLVSVAGRAVLVIDRFDRVDDGRRRGYMSAMTALEATDGDVRSYVDIAEVLEEQALEVTAELAQLWRRVAFSILISNTDDHLRNHALLHVRGNSWTPSWPRNWLAPDWCRLGCYRAGYGWPALERCPADRGNRVRICLSADRCRIGVAVGSRGRQ